MSMRWLMLALTLVSAACGDGDPARMVAPTPTPVTPAPPPTPVFRGTVSETLTGAPVPGFTATANGSRVSVSAPGYVTREAAITAANVDLIRDAGQFNLSFYRQFARNALEAPDTLQPLRRQRQSPRVYVRTIDESGAPVHPTALDIVLSSITPALVEAFSGGTMTLAGLEQGTETRIGMTGWITVSWPTEFSDGRCGQAAVGGDRIELLHTRPTCRYPRLIKHELGHAMGFWHTDDRNDVMFSSSTNDVDNNPSAREKHHAAIAYNRPIGSRDVDVDPTTGALSSRGAMVVD
jgi:hypothetical protein